MIQTNKEITIWDVDLKVEFEYEPIIPAKTSGPPENCHPEEGGEVEINEVYLEGWDVTALLSDKVQELIKKEIKEKLSDLDENTEEEDG